MLKKFQHSSRQNSRNLSITVFRGLNFIKHCNAQKIPKFPTQNSRNTVMLQKIPKIPNFGIYGRAGADSLKIWNFLSITVFREF